MILCLRLLTAAFCLTALVSSQPGPRATPVSGPQPSPSDLYAVDKKLHAHTHSAAADVWPRSLISIATPALPPAAVALPKGIKPAPVSNQSAEASAAVIAAISLYGSNLIPFGYTQRHALAAALGATVLASTNMQFMDMEVLSVSEYTPTNTTSPSPSRRLLVIDKPLGRQLQQAATANGAYVQVQIAILTSGNMATGLQLQLIADVAGPLLNALQSSGLAVTSITLDILDVQEPPDPSLLVDTQVAPTPAPAAAGATSPPLIKTASSMVLSGSALGAILGVGIPLALGVGLAAWAVAVHRKRYYSAFAGSLIGTKLSSKWEDSSLPPSPVFTSGERSSPRPSSELRRARSESVLAIHRRGFGHVSPHALQLSAQMEFLGFPLAREWVTGKGSMHCSGDLSMAARAALLATQIKDEAALGPVHEESLHSTFGDGSNQWRSSNTSSSSQTNAAIQRMTRLDTAAWQIAYKELKFSRLIGEGSFGRVFLGKWRETTVAIKLLNPTVRKASHGSDSDDGELGSHQVNSCKPGLLDDLDKEAGIMAALRHPNVVMFLGVCLEPPCMVAEFCARGSMHDVLTRASRSKTLQQQLDWVRRINMALDAAKGMLYLHMCQPPILHRDLKSANLLVSKHWKVKVSDFNLSRVMEASSMASSVGATNPRWVAPEVLGGGQYGKAADVYAFGVILWEILTWQVPWDDLGPWQVVIDVVDRKARPEVPPLHKLPGGELCLHGKYIELMEDCWAQDPLARPSFEAVIGRLRVINDAETSLLAQQADKRRSSSEGSVQGLCPTHRASTSISEGLLRSVAEGTEAELPASQQIQDVVTATKAAQALVEAAHREIELSGIQPVLRLASLDAKIPLSMLRLPSDPASTTPIQPIGFSPLGLGASNGHMCLGSPPISCKARRRVSWNSQQLAQVMSQHEGGSLDIPVSGKGGGGVGNNAMSIDMADVALRRAQMALAMSTEAVAGSPNRDLELSDQNTMGTQPSLGQTTVSNSSSGMLLSSSRRRSFDRMVSPFALTPAPSRS
ncbi:hypothetical protein WJX77_000667 [Trebouxia sp. C0004]